MVPGKPENLPTTSGMNDAFTNREASMLQLSGMAARDGSCRHQPRSHEDPMSPQAHTDLNPDELRNLGDGSKAVREVSVPQAHCRHKQPVNSPTTSCVMYLIVADRAMRSCFTSVAQRRANAACRRQPRGHEDPGTHIRTKI